MAGGRSSAVTKIADALRAPGALDDPETVAAVEEVGLGIISVDGAGRVRWSDSAYRWHGRPRWQRVRSVEDSLSEVQVGAEELRSTYRALATGTDSPHDPGVRYVVTGEHKVAHTVYLLPIGRGTALVSGRPFEAEEWDQPTSTPTRSGETAGPVERAMDEIVGAQRAEESAVRTAVEGPIDDVTIDLTDSARARAEAGAAVGEAEEAQPQAPMPETRQPEVLETEAPKFEAPKSEAPKPEVSEAQTRSAQASRAESKPSVPPREGPKAEEPQAREPGPEGRRPEAGPGLLPGMGPVGPGSVTLPSQWHELFAASPVAMVLLDPDNRLGQANDAFCLLVGAGRAQILAMNYGPQLAAAVEASAPVDTSQPQEAPIEGEHPGVLLAEHHLRRPDGEQRWVRLRTSQVQLDGTPYRLVTVEDLTTARETEYRLRREALHDQLTGLPNRRLLVDRLDRALTRGRRTQGGVAVFFIDVDDLKRVNDTYGHAGGDLMIVTVARALRAALRDADTLARIGGDEFVAVCEDLGDDRSLDEVGDRLIHAVSAPLVLDGDHVTISLSVGVATPHEGGEDAESLLDRADAAMYRAKVAGGGRLSTSPRTDEAGGATEMAATDWLAAMSAGQLRLEYRPVVHAHDGQVLGVEGRLRWRHPSLGELTAIDLLDHPGTNRAMAELVRWSVRTALTDLQAATPAGAGPLTLWLTVPFRALVQHGVAEAVAAAYRDLHGPKVPALVLEVQERGLASLIRRGKPPRELDRLAAAGPVSVGVGRFDGCALPLGILARLPLRSVKLHRDVVSHATHAEGAATVMAGLVTGVNALGALTIAGGVDHTEQLQMARRAGVVAVQGKLVGGTVSATELAALLAGPPVRLGIAPVGPVAAEATKPVPVPSTPPQTRPELLLPGGRVDLTVDIGATLAAEIGVPLPGEFDSAAEGRVRQGARPHLLLRAPRLARMVPTGS